MNKISLEELKKIELEILVFIKQVCSENNLRYFLCGGTLLGAVRHKGFIPWDDDIDIMMPRPDYDKFVELLKAHAGRFQILAPAQEGYYYNFAKVVDSNTLLVEHTCQPIGAMGVYVDVFPIEGMPQEEDARDRHFAKLERIRTRINHFSMLRPQIRKNLILYVKNMVIFGCNKASDLGKCQKAYTRLARCYSYEDAQYVYMSGGAYRKKELFPKSFIGDTTTVVFEGEEFSAPANWDLYLTQLYGDYMQLPPKEKQVTHHHFTAQYRNDK